MFCFEALQTTQNMISEIVNHFREIAVQDLLLLLSRLLWFWRFSFEFLLQFASSTESSSNDGKLLEPLITTITLLNTLLLSQKVLTSHRDHITSSKLRNLLDFIFTVDYLKACRIVNFQRAAISNCSHFILNKFSFNLSSTRKNFL
jgi:hypothetical protein